MMALRALGRAQFLRQVATVKTAPVAFQAVRPFTDYVRRWNFKMAGYNQYGLYYDDLLNESPDVEEALRRLPPQLLDERHYRIARALQLAVLRTILPKEEWSTYEDDVEKGAYLQPYLKEVRREWEEKEMWSQK